MRILLSCIFLFAITASACSEHQADDSIKVTDSIPAQSKLNGNDTIKPLSDSSFMEVDSISQRDSANMPTKEKKFRELSNNKKTSQEELTKRMQKGAQTQFHPHILKGDSAK